MNLDLLILFFIPILLLIPFLIYIGYCIYFYIVQRRFIYAPQFDIEVKSKEKVIEHEEVNYRTVDGINISAWYVPFREGMSAEPESPHIHKELKEPIPLPESVKKGKVILFCHGNSGNITQRIDTFKIFQQLGYSTFIFDYRGYGQSEGEPSEKGTYLDADGAWDYLVTQKKMKPEDIIVFGRSLGGAIASYIAQKYHPLALVIESSFTAITDMAKILFPLLPLKLLLRFKYNTRERLKYINCPILIIHSPDDRTIPFICGKILFEGANPPKKILRIKGDHLYGFYQSKNAYIKGLKKFFIELPDLSLTVETATNE
jgi:uncharacterized protein